MHDLDVSLNWKNMTHKGKAPKVVLGLGNSSDGSPMRAKVGAQQTNHRLFRPVGRQRSDDHNLLLKGAMGGGPFVMGLCPLQVGGGNRSSTRHNLLGVNDGSSGCSQEGLGHLDKPCLSSSSTLPLLGGRGLGESHSSSSYYGKGLGIGQKGALARVCKECLLDWTTEASRVRGGIGGAGQGPRSGGSRLWQRGSSWKGLHIEALNEGAESNDLSLGSSRYGMLDKTNFGDCVDSL
jgi:hypothetical protein